MTRRVEVAASYKNKDIVLRLVIDDVVIVAHLTPIEVRELGEDIKTELMLLNDWASGV